jgi:hypothetical protein
LRAELDVARHGKVNIAARLGCIGRRPTAKQQAGEVLAAARFEPQKFDI